METIVAAAIRVRVSDDFRKIEWKGKPFYPEFLTISAPPPMRHGQMMHPFAEIAGHRTAPDDQGFLTSTGRFVSREHALKIAVAAGQPLIDHPSRCPHRLYSEDLW